MSMRYQPNELLASLANDDQGREETYRSALGKLTRRLYVYRELLPDNPLMGAILESVEALYREKAVQSAIGAVALRDPKRTQRVTTHANLDARTAVNAAIGKLPPVPSDEELIPIGCTADIIQVVRVMKEKRSRDLTYIALIARTVTATATGMQGRPLFHRSRLGNPEVDAT